MLDVFLTVDVEVWCDGWVDIDRKFPHAFRAYVYGETAAGGFGLPYQVATLRSRGLTGVFFVEPLFSTRFGAAPLREIVSLIQAGQQEVQLHLHTEWVDESCEPLLPNVQGKRQHLRHFDLSEQKALIATGLRLLRDAGADGVNAFRAGSFACNRDTLTALHDNDIAFDSSYNASMIRRESGILPGECAVEPFFLDGVHEYPMTVFRDGTRRLRHAQITACSFREIEGLLWAALESERKAFVLLSHNFELLNPGKTDPDWIAIRRFEKLCDFLHSNSDCFRVRGFRGLVPQATEKQPAPLKSPRWKTLERLAEQIYRRVYE